MADFDFVDYCFRIWNRLKLRQLFFFSFVWFAQSFLLIVVAIRFLYPAAGLFLHSPCTIVSSVLMGVYCSQSASQIQSHTCEVVILLLHVFFSSLFLHNEFWRTHTPTLHISFCNQQLTVLHFRPHRLEHNQK